MTPAEQVLKRLDEIEPGILIGLGAVAAGHILKSEYDTSKRMLAGKTRARYGLEHDIAQYRIERDRIDKSGKSMVDRADAHDALERRYINMMANKIRTQRNREAKAKNQPRIVGGPAKKDIRTARRGLYGTFGGHRPLFRTEGDL